MHGLLETILDERIENAVFFIRGETEMSKQRNKFVDAKARLTDDRPQCAAVKFFVIRNGGLGGRRFTNQHEWLPRCL